MEQLTELERRDVEVVARALAAAQAKSCRTPPDLISTFVDATWHRHADAALLAIRDLDAERLRRALFACGDMAKALVQAEAMSADAQAYRGVLEA